jgi:hypothetical protein
MLLHHGVNESHSIRQDRTVSNLFVYRKSSLYRGIVLCSCFAYVITLDSSFTISRNTTRLSTSNISNIIALLHIKMDTSSSPEDQQFHLFPHLPFDIRELIWKDTFKPRIVYLRPTLLVPGYTDRIWSNKTVDDESFFNCCEYVSGRPSPPKLAFNSRSTIPALSVCRESRKIASNVYTLAFGPTSYPSTWFDFKRDTLYVDWMVVNPDAYGEDAMESDASYVPRDLGPDLEMVEKLAICDGLPKSWWLNGWEGEYKVLYVLRSLSAIKIITVMDRAHDSENLADLVMMDGISAINQELSFLGQHSDYTPEVEQQRQEFEDYHICLTRETLAAYEHTTKGLRDGRLNLGMCARRGCTFVHWDPKSTFVVPTIEHKTVTTAKKREAYLNMTGDYDIQKTLWLKAHGGD